MMGSVRSNGCDLYYEEVGQGVPILLIHPAGATASTWGSATQELGRIGRVIIYDRRGYARSGGQPVPSVATHTADAAALLEAFGDPARGRGRDQRRSGDRGRPGGASSGAGPGGHRP
jgi:pimeloyl-ACP methyl ester carboxylesterase